MQPPFARPVPRYLPGSSRVVHRVQLPWSPEDVFEFVTNPAQWHRWQPRNRSVHDVADQPLGAGESVVERVRVLHRRLRAEWTVTGCEPASWWEMRTRTAAGAAVLTLRLSPSAGGTWLERTCEYRSEGLWRVLDGTLTRWLLDRQAAQAMARLHRLVGQAAGLPPA